MQCPKCDGSLEPKQYTDIQIHRCNLCAGLWCKPEELTKMRGEWMSEVELDSGDPRTGARLNKVEDIRCPVCGIALDKESDPKQTHIWYESCPEGHGIFLDAGEFTDLKFTTFIDVVRDMLTRKRGN